MPPYLLTKAQKAELRRQYIANVELINQYLPEDNQIRVDLAWFNSRINDPTEQRFYLKSRAINEKLNKKIEIGQQLANKYAHLRDKNRNYTYDRGVMFDLLPVNPGVDRRVDKYNEAIMKEYLTNPEAYAQRRIEKMMNFNPEELQQIRQYGLPDEKNFLLDYYEQNEEIIDDALRFQGTLEANKKELIPELKENFKAIGGNYEMLSIASTTARLAKHEGFFTFPPLTDEQLDILDNGPFGNEHFELSNKMANFKREIDTFNNQLEEYHNAMDALDRRDVNISLESKGALNKFVGTITRMENNPNEKISPLTVYSGNIAGQGENFQLIKLDKQTCDKMEKPFAKDYVKETGYKHLEVPESLKWANDTRNTFRRDFVYAYAKRERVEIGKVDTAKIGTLAEAIKGDWKERLLNTTSSQYKAFIKAMYAYDNPNSRHYNDSRYVYEKANKYLIHKGVRSLEDVLNLPHPGNKRARLCWEVMDSYEKNIEPTTLRFERGTNNTYAPEVAPLRSPVFLNQVVQEEWEKDGYLEKAPNLNKQKANVKLDDEDVELFSDLVNEIKEPGMK